MFQDGLLIGISGNFEETLTTLEAKILFLVSGNFCTGNLSAEGF